MWTVCVTESGVCGAEYGSVCGEGEEVKEMKRGERRDEVNSKESIQWLCRNIVRI